MGFREEERESLEALETYDEKGDVFRYLREETNAATYYTRLVMLISALEAIAGQSPTRRGRSTDKDYIRQEIVQDDELFDRLLKYGEGVRNLLLHGSKVDLASSEHRDFNYAVQLHGKICGYFNRKHHTKINMAAIDVPRASSGNYKTLGMWLTPRPPETLLDLRTLVEQFPEEGDEDSQVFWTAFGQCDMPANY